MIVSPETRRALLRKSQSVLKCFTVAGIAGYVLVRVAVGKLNEYIDAYQAERNSDDLIVAHFERIRRQAKEINASFLPELSALLTARYSIDDLLAKLHADWLDDLDPEEGRQERLKIWNQIKMEVVSKTISGIYATSLLSLLIASQMAVIGKYVYLKDVLDKSSTTSNNSSVSSLEFEMVPAIGKALMSICTRFSVSGVETIDSAVNRATSLVLSRVDVQQQVSRMDLDECVASIRHEIEDAAGRDIIEEVLLGHDVLSDAFSLLPSSHRPLANRIFGDLKGSLNSVLFKHILSGLVQRKIDSVVGLACEELYSGHQEPLLLSIIPNINSEFWIVMSPKMLAEQDPQITTMMAAVFRSTKPL